MNALRCDTSNNNWRISMNRFMTATLALSLLGFSANAQTTTASPPVSTPSTTTGPSTTMPTTTSPTSAPATKMPDAGAPLAGSNSFTESQATARIVELGFTEVKGLSKDASGVWRGMAMKDGKSQNVALDFKGNIVVGQN
jgi:hypothetical protein